MNNQLENTHKIDFDILYYMITEAKSKVWQQINTTLIDLYWNIGKYISKKVEISGWGKNVVEQLSKYLTSRDTSIKGFSARNIWRMKQFFETYCEHEKLSALLTEISWTNHLHILSKTKSIEEKEYYLNLAAINRYSERIFARLKVQGDHNISISNYTKKTQRYTYKYVLSCESAYENFERAIEIYPQGNFTDNSHSYGVVQKNSAGTCGINVSTQITDGESAWHEAHATLRVRR